MSVAIERGVYFDAWFPGQHCYHPSLPPRRLKMVDDLRDYRSTVLVWSALGGGSISLPYLEEEAFGEIDPRFRMYGFVNDAEFIAECRTHGIKVFGIVFEVQGWEFPAELSEDEDRVLALNELRGVGKRGWLGLREFSQNRYPKLWPPFERYFPGGLVNALGEPVTDLLEECCSRDIFGQPCHAHWVECPDREHYCYTMDRNNPVWREYLKAIVRLQIDAGVDGVQLDEAELPLTSLQYGGCFCKDCMGQFRDYLRALPADERPADLAGVDLATFHYGQWLLAQGIDFKSDRESAPLYWHYIRFQRGAIARYFAEIADYAREYAASKGREVLVSGNFFNLLDQYYALEPKVDLIVTEMRNTRYKQPTWYRYVAGFAGPKPVVVVENPYGGVVPELVGKLKAGKGHDLFRLSLYEAAALGANMSVPYGAWVGSIVEDSFWAPHDLCVEIQSFLADNEALFGRTTANQVGVVYSVGSNFGPAARSDVANNQVNASQGAAIPFWVACDALSDANQPFDVVFFPDGTLRPDTITADDLRQYRTLVLPDCSFLTDAEATALAGYLDAGGCIVALGKLATNLPDAERRRIADHPGVTLLRPEEDLGVEHLDGGRQVRVTGDDNVAVNLQRLDGGIAVHLIRYGYDEALDAVPTAGEVTLELRLPEEFGRMSLHAPAGALSGELALDGDIHRIRLRDVPLYSVAMLHAG